MIVTPEALGSRIENMNRLLFCIKRRMSMTERMKEEDQDKDGRALGE